MTTENSTRFLKLKARVERLDLELIEDDELRDDERGYYVLDPKTRKLRAEANCCNLDGIEHWLGEREEEATDADEEQACAAAFERQKAAGMHADVADEQADNEEEPSFLRFTNRHPKRSCGT